MDAQQEQRLKKAARKVSIVEGSAYAASEGIGIRYITPYAVALGASGFQVGILNSLPNLAGSFAQLYALRLMSAHTRKRILFIGAFVQALLWLLVIAAGALFFLVGARPLAPWALIVVYTSLIMVGFALNPVWSSWMKDVVPQEILGSYFGRRSRIAGSVGLVMMIAAGFMLDLLKGTSVFLSFAILFSGAFVARSISAVLFLRKYEPEFSAPRPQHTFGFFVYRMQRHIFGKFVLFTSMILLATAVASPFFAVYMLEELGFSYSIFMIVMISSIVGSLIFMPAWGRFADRYGNRKVMIICGAMIPVIPLAWLLAPFLAYAILVPYLIAVELFSGFVWAGFNLASGNYIYDTVPREKLHRYIAFFNIFTNLGTFLGAMIGGSMTLLPWTFAGSTFLFIFLLSGIIRLVAYLAFIPAVKEVRAYEDFQLEDAARALRHLSLGSILRIIR